MTDRYANFIQDSQDDYDDENDAADEEELEEDDSEEYEEEYDEDAEEEEEYEEEEEESDEEEYEEEEEDEDEEYDEDEEEESDEEESEELTACRGEEEVEEEIPAQPVKQAASIQKPIQTTAAATVAYSFVAPTSRQRPAEPQSLPTPVLPQPAEPIAPSPVSTGSNAVPSAKPETPAESIYRVAEEPSNEAPKKAVPKTGLPIANTFAPKRSGQIRPADSDDEEQDIPYNEEEETGGLIRRLSGKFSARWVAVAAWLAPLLKRFGRRAEEAEDELDARLDRQIEASENDLPADAAGTDEPTRNWRNIRKKTGVVAGVVSLLMFCGYMGTVLLSPTKRAELTEEAKNQLALAERQNNPAANAADASPAADAANDSTMGGFSDLDEESKKLEETAQAIQNKLADSTVDQVKETTDALSGETVSVLPDAESTAADLPAVDLALSDFPVTDTQPTDMDQADSTSAKAALAETVSSEPAPSEEGVAKEGPNFDPSLAGFPEADDSALISLPAVEPVAQPPIVAPTESASLSPTNEIAVPAAAQALVPTRPAEPAPRSGTLTVTLPPTTSAPANNWGDSLQSSLSNAQQQFNSFGNSVADAVDSTARNIADQVQSGLETAAHKTDEAFTSIQQTGEQVRDSVTGAYNQTRDSLSATGEQIRDNVTGVYNQTRDSLLATGEQINRGVENGVDLTRDSLQALTAAPSTQLTAAPAVPTAGQSSLGPVASGRTGALTAVPPQAGNASLNLAPAQTPSGTSLSLPTPTMNHSALGNYSMPGESIAAPNAAVPTASAAPAAGNTFPVSPSAALPTASAGTQTAQGGRSAPFGTSLLSTGTTSVTGTIRAPGAVATDALTGGYRNYTTKERDNLLTIAENELGDSTRWGEIRRLNSDKDLTGSIPAGTVIKLPASAVP